MIKPAVEAPDDDNIIALKSKLPTILFLFFGGVVAKSVCRSINSGKQVKAAHLCESPCCH